jgi:glycosyltransferase involved in cell wall biosynthesis
MTGTVPDTSRPDVVPAGQVESLRILLVSQMYPSPDDLDLGSFVADLERALRARGHELALSAVTRRAGGPGRHLALARDTARAARRFRPDVVYAHFLVPAGLWAALFGGAPLVVTAHGQDVENARTRSAVRAATRIVVRRAAGVIAVSDWLARRLVEAVPEARGRTQVIDCGVDLARFRPRDAAAARQSLGWAPEGTAFVCVGSLSERKNVVRLARAFERRGEGTLAFVGDGPLRPWLEGRRRIHLAGAVPHERVADWIAAADVVCQPSLVEPFGLVTLEALASGRPVVATRTGGPAEFVPKEAGVLVDPGDDEAIARALDAAAALPDPGSAARVAAEAHDLFRQAERIEAVLLRARGGRS